MNMQKTGDFLKELRKNNHMTQEQLGDKLGVTNKTVSRWETGSYMPPVDILKQLSDIYQISINEILAGERLTNEQYPQIADENISNILENTESKNQKAEKTLICMMYITLILAILIMVLLPKDLKGIIITILVAAMALISNVLNLIALIFNKQQTIS